MYSSQAHVPGQAPELAGDIYYMFDLACQIQTSCMGFGGALFPFESLIFYLFSSG